jgi:hypothetical protein
MATLRLSLPLPLMRWKMADLKVLVVYEPERPAVTFRVADVRLSPQLLLYPVTDPRPSWAV